MVFSFKYLLLICVNLILCRCAENCDKYGVLLYEDLACKPIRDEGEECPSKFNCDFSQPKSGCLFKGKTYAFGESIPSDLTYSGCQIGCFCHDSNSITCAVLDCIEYLSRRPEPGCYYSYKLGDCCSKGDIRCNTTDVEPKTCEVDGEYYEIGQKFYPKNSCLQCVCHENFTGEYDEATCMRQNCVTQVHYSSEIARNCAPAYFTYRSDEVYCCPDHFVCPESTDTIKLWNHEAPQDTGLECSYGEKKLKLGEGLTRKINKYGKDRNLQCECIVPPFLTCKEH